MKRKTTIITSLLIFSLTMQGQNIIPHPKSLKVVDGYFSMPKEINVYAKNTNRINTEQVIEYFDTENISTKLTNRKKSALHLEKSKNQKCLKKLLLKNKLNNYEVGDEGYVLNIAGNKIQIYALTNAGIFYGFQTLKQLITEYKVDKKIPAMVIYDKPDIAIRAWQDDISRGPIPTMDLLKEQIKVMSSYKLNYFTLYTEHVFQLEKHPSIAPKNGITKNELAQLSKFAKQHYVTLIGNYQSFGHMEKTLRHSEYKHLAENDHILSPALDESYEFLSEVYEEIVPLYDGEYFNINCDETFGLGQGQSKAMVDSIGVPGVYTYHINKIDGLLKKYNKKILMWGDIAASHPKIVPNLPNDMTVIPWAYHPAESFDYVITPISDQNLDFWVAPGVGCWQNIYPSLKASSINIYNFIRDGYKLGTSGVLNTSWDDDGLNFFNSTWHGFIWGAELSWNAPSNFEKETSENDRIKRYKKFNHAFDIQYHNLRNDVSSISSIMNSFALLHESNVRHALKNTRFFEPIFPIHLDYVMEGKEQENRHVLSKLDSLEQQLILTTSHVAKNREKLDYLLFAINQAQFTIKKNLFRISLHAYMNGDKELMKVTLKENILGLIDEAKILKIQYIDLWNRENRNHWLDENTSKYDDMIYKLTALDGHVLVHPQNEVDKHGRKIRLYSIFNDFPIHYTINGDTVSAASPSYTEPFYINENSTILARSIDSNFEFPLQKIDLLQHKGIGRLHNLESEYSQYHPSYDGGGKYALVDGYVGVADNLKSGKWQGFAGQDIVLELEFPEDEKLQNFSMGFFQNTFLWVIFPKQVEIYIKESSDEEYSLFKTIKGSISPKEEGNLKEVYSTSLENISPSHIKVIARYYGKLPEWHHAGSSYESMIFADEIIIK